jgi:hypothetical protein
MYVEGEVCIGALRGVLLWSFTEMTRQKQPEVVRSR